MSTDEHEMDFKSMLLDLSKSLTNDELEQMKFMCKDFIRKRDRENVKRAIDLWEQLEMREKIGPRNLDFLQQLVFKCCNGRLDVLRIIEKYVNGGYSDDIQFTIPPVQPDHGVQNVMFQPMHIPVMQPAQQPYGMHNYSNIQRNSRSTNYVEVLKKEINFLTRNLGKEWRFFMRTLGVSDSDMLAIEQDHPRNLRDQIYQCMSLVLSDCEGKLTKSDLILALKDPSVERFDLAARIEDGDI